MLPGSVLYYRIIELWGSLRMLSIEIRGVRYAVGSTVISTLTKRHIVRPGRLWLAAG